MGVGDINKTAHGAVSVGVKTDGMGDLVAKLLRAKRLVPVVLRGEIQKAAGEIFRQSQAMVPVDTSALKDSGRLFSQGQTRAVVYTIAYGNAMVDYATEVHENLQTRHRNGRAKYLQIPYDRVTKSLPSKVSKAIKGSIF